jgi:hypothetical protein
VLSAAWGIYHQQIIGLYNARDVTDAFVAWSPSPEGTARVPKSMHILGGWRSQLLPGLSLNVEAFYKELSHLAFAEYRDELAGGLIIDPVDGTARGLDARIAVTRPAFYGAVSYGLASVEYERTVVPDDEGAHPVTERFPPPHDRRHQINALTRLVWGPYAVSVRWHFGSGLPFTPVAGFYDAVAVTTPDDTGFRTQPGQPVLVSSPERYTARLPAYHRLDVAVERRFEMGRLHTRVQASVINLYDRANLFDYDLFAGRRVNQLPLIPSLGVTVEVR